MDLQHKLEAAIDLARKLDVTVRHAPLGGDGGGLCTVRGQRVLFIDSAADLATQYERALTDLVQIPELNGMFILPELREDFARFQAESE